MKQHLKATWRPVENLLGKQKMPTKVDELIIDEEKLTNPDDIAENFNKYF
jgi:hypothetical protein